MFSVKDAPRDVVVTAWKQAKEDLGTQPKEDLGKQAKEDLRTQAERLAFEIERLKKKDVELMILMDSRMPPKLLQRKLKLREAEIRKTAARNLLVHKPLAAPGHGRFRMRNKKSRSECLELAKKNNSSSNTTKDEEAVAVGSSRSAMKDDEEVMMMPNKFGILDRDGDDEIDRGKSAIEEEHMPSDWKNTSEESVVVGGSGKSAMDQAVISLEREEPVTDALKEAEESVLLVGMDSTGLEPSIWKQSQEGALLLGPQSLLQKEADSDGGRRTMCPIPDLSTVITAQLQDNLWQSEAETEQKKAHKETEAKKPKSKQKKKKNNPKMRTEHVEDSIGSYQFGERNYEGVTHQEATRLEKKHLEQLAKKNKKKVKDEDAGKAVASVKDAGKAELSVTEAGRLEESVTEAEEALKKEAKEGALLVGMDSTGGVSSMQKQAQEGALLLGPDSMADESLLQKEAEAESGKRFRIIVDGKLYPAITHQEAEKLMDEIHERREALKRDLQAKQDAKGKETKAEVSVTEAGRPEESATEAEEALKKQAEEGALLNSTGSEPLMCKEAEEEPGKRPERQLYAEIQRALLYIQEKLAKKNWKTDKRTLQLLKDMYKLDMLDHGSDDKEMDEIDDRGELDIDQTCLDTNLDPLAKEMADEAESFASYSRLWEYKWGKTRGFFTDPTVLSSMQFTHYTPGRLPYSMECSTLETLQIISIKLTELADGLELPLSVYGVVAVRDMLDRNRNILFSRDWRNPQELKQNDPFLPLTGPSRAIVFMDKVCIEINLRVKSRACSQDKALISCVRRYTGVNGPGVSTICFKNSLCTIEVCLQPVKQTVQATILGVQVASEDGSWPLKYGGLVACSPQSGKRVFTDSGYTRRINPSSTQIVLIDSRYEGMPKGENGHVLLRRQVVSVHLDGRLDFFIKAYSQSGDTAAETRVHFYPKVCNISQKKCYLGDAGVTVTVAWSVVAANKKELCLEEGALLNSTGSEPLMCKEAEEEPGKRPERQLYAEIQRALLDIQEKLAKKNWKTDKRTLQLLKDMSNKLDMLDHGSDDKEMDEIDDRGELDIDQTCLDTNLDPLAKEMADEAESFASYSRLWEYKWGKTRGFFTDPTVLSSMQFTHYTPGRLPYSMECSTLETLQIISIKLTELTDGLELPLSVYGVVAVRDMLDRNRNILFSRDWRNPQELKQNDPFLPLTGPSRAIVFIDKVCIEINLRVKSGAYSQDKALISCVRRYTGVNGPGVSTICFKNSLCTVEMCLQPVKQTVQATILGVQVASEDGSWPLKYGGLVACSPQSGKRVFTDSGYTRRINPSSTQIVLIDSRDEGMPKGENGHVLLRRQVVSVHLDGRLDFFIKAYSQSGDTAAETRVHFYPKVCNISQKKCYLGDAGVTVTVAWSVVAANKTELCLELKGGSIF